MKKLKYPAIKISILGISLLLFSMSKKDNFTVPGFSMPRDSTVLFSCSFASGISDDDCIPDNLSSSFSSNSLDAARVLKKILDAMSQDTTVKVQPNFFLFECDFPEPVFKALTKRYDTSRYILYTKEILKKLVSDNTDWVAFSIFAHEVAHHLYGHSLSGPKNMAVSRQRELEADLFCGYILNKLHSTLSQAQSGVNAVGQHPSDELEELDTHPTKVKRLQAIQQGFEMADNKNLTLRTFLNVDSLAKQKSLEFIYNKTLRLIMEKRFNEALLIFEKFSAQIPAKYKADVYYSRGFIKREAGDINGAINDFTKAINVNGENAVYYQNRGELKRDLSDKVLKAEGIEDLKNAGDLNKMSRKIQF